MSARVHHISFREFIGPRTKRKARPFASSTVGRFLERLYRQITEPPTETEVGQAFGYSFAKRRVPVTGRPAR